MKRKIVVGLLCLTMAAGLVACGGESSSSSTSTESKTESSEGVDNISAADVIDKEIISCVKLGDYKELEVELTGDYSSDEAAVNDYIDSKITAEYVEDKSKKTVEKDSIVNVDYMGKKDGVAFDGGTAEGVLIDVGNNSDAERGTGYIEGFTDGLVGAKVGETVDCPCTFPENYGSAELAGQDVIFTFKVNYIAKKDGIDHSSLTDEYVKEKYGADTVEEYKKQAKSELEAENESKKETDIRSQILETVVANAKIDELPEGLLDKRLEDYKVQFTSMYASEGQTLEDYLKSTYDVTIEQFEKEARSNLQQTLERELIFLAIADKEGIELDSDGYDGYIKNMMNSYGSSSKEEIYKKFGQSKDDGKVYLAQVYLCNKAVDLCVDSAKVK